MHDSIPPPLPVEPVAVGGPPIVRWAYIAQAINVTTLFTVGNVNPTTFNQTLNWYGSQGWELVSTFDTAGVDGGTRTVVLIFKRPILE
jgi:hypothetical protein